MGHIEFLVSGGSNSPSSLSEYIDELTNSSVIFMDAWQSTPTDMQRASSASEKAMAYMDHIVNEIMRMRDKMKADGEYAGSSLESLLETNAALSASPITRVEQVALVQAGPGNGNLSGPGEPLKMEKLLNKIKHRRPGCANFEVGTAGEHYFYLAADKPNLKPDSIVKFNIREFCQHCYAIIQII